MRNITTGFLMLLGTLGIAQTQDSANFKIPRNEIKVNAILPFWGKAEVSYERILNQHSSVGASVFYDFTEPKNSFYFSPYYRHYFGKKFNQGFFLEGNAIISTPKNTFFSAENKNGNTLFGLGIGTGYKFLTKKNNWIIEPNISFGNFFKTENETYFRVGIGIGKRF